MKTSDDFDLRSDDLGLRLTAWMAATAPTREPVGLVADAVGRTGSVRQRPAFFVRTGLRDGRFAGPVLSPRVKLLLLAALLLVAVGAAAAVGARFLAPPVPVEHTSRTYRGVVAPAGTLTTGRGGLAAVRLLDGRVLIVGDGDARLAEVLPYSDRVTTAGGTEEPWPGWFSLTQEQSSRLPQPVLGGSAITLPRLALLPDGRVLIVGQLATTDDRSLAQVYDPQTNTIQEVGPMTQSRLEPAVAALADGRVLVAGGVAPGREPLASAELFDPRSGTFSPAAAMPAPRGDDFATPLDDGRVLITSRWCGLGGCQASRSPDREPLIYDPATGTFERPGPMAGQAGSVPPVRLADGRILILGPPVDGCGRTGIDPSPAQIFDPATDTFAPAPPIPHGATTATPLLDGRVLLTGQWTLMTGTWTASPPAPDDCGAQRMVHGWMAVYDPVTGEARSSIDPTTGDRGLDVDVRDQRYAAAVRLLDGRVLLIGGRETWDANGRNVLELFE